MQELIQELIEEIKRLTEQLQDQNGQDRPGGILYQPDERQGGQIT